MRHRDDNATLSLQLSLDGAVNVHINPYHMFS